MSATAAAANADGTDAAPNRIMITVAVMGATIVQVLDTTIVNVALPHMQGELGATADQISWVLTSYLIATAIVMPLTGYLTDILGRKRLLLISVAGFVASSALCGVSQNVSEIVVFRLLQGAFGAALTPLSQAIMADAYPIEERGRAMSIWGVGVMVAPVLGPTLGGWLTDAASWRWTFYINVPVGVISLALASQFVAETPRRERDMDWTGLGLISLGIASLQYMFDRGTRRDWFDSSDIRISAALGVAGVVLFIWHAFRKRERAIFNIRIFADRNLRTACFITFAMGIGMFGGLILQPILLERLLDYPVMDAGLLMAPRGFSMGIAMLLIGHLDTRIDARVSLLIGILLSALGSYGMTLYSLQVSTFDLIWPAALQGLGFGLTFVPLATMAYATLARSQMAEAAGLYSLVRTVGSALGISVVTTIVSHQTVVLWNDFSAYVTVYHDGLVNYLGRMHLAPNDPRGLAVVAHEVARQAEMGALLDTFRAVTLSFLLLLPLILFMKKPKRRGEFASQPTAGIE